MARRAVTEADANVTLALENTSKVFQGQRALDQVSLTLRRGEVHALLGQNGSGKSTLIKILAGFHYPEPGARALLRGEPFPLGSATAAAEGGIRFIHQDLGLVEDLSVVDNLALGRRYAGSWWLSDRRELRAARQLLSDFDVPIDPATPVRALSPARRTMVAIVRALRGGIGENGILVLDEPTASLPASEAEHLFGMIEAVRLKGAAILYVTHRLDEVFRIARRVSVLRDGRLVATVPTSELGHDGLVELIVGKPLEEFYPEVAAAREGVALGVSDLGGESVHNVSLKVHEGEIVGVTGLVGSGHEALLHMIFGSRARRSGDVRVAGARLRPSPKASIAAGVAFAPADRKRLSAIPGWTLRENVTLPALRPKGVLRWLGEDAERPDVVRWLESLEVRPAEPERKFSSLSGGNQQRAVLARWLRCAPRALMLEEPTSGVDVGAKVAIYRTLAEIAAQGTAVLLTSSDAEELCSVCDRVLVMRRGRVAAELRGSTLNVERVLTESMRTA
jgi:ribose transport system ATP-binding protein